MERKEDVGLYHLCTDGSVLSWMFKDKEDFIAGINRIGICKILSDVSVWAYSLMDNHVHFLLQGSLQNCELFINKYKLLTSKWVAKKYQQSGFLKYLPIAAMPLRTEDDILETAAYIDRNSIMAGFNGLPFDYPWSSSRFMFRANQADLDSFCSISECSPNQLREIFKTRVDIPLDWRYDNTGMIDPRCFTEYNMLEALFKSAIRYMYFVNKKIEGKVELSLNNGYRAFIQDRDLRVIVEDLSLSRFGVKDIRTLDVKSRLSIAKTLRYDYASTPKQISRMLGVDLELLKGFI